MAIKLKLLTFRILFLVLDKLHIKPVKEVIYRKKKGHRAFKRDKHVDRCKNTHHHCICRYFSLSARARCMTWRDVVK